MRLHTILLLTAVLIFSAAACWAYPTLSGSTGMVTLPSADVAPQGTAELAVSYQKIKTDTSILGDSISMYGMPDDVELKIMPARLVMGLAQGTEAWVGYTHISGDEDGKLWNGGLKYQFANEMQQGVTAAIGGQYSKLTNSVDMKVTSAFLALSKEVKDCCDGKGKATLSLGVLYQKFGDPVDDSSTQPYIGVEVDSGKGSFAAEYRLKDDDFDCKAPFSAVLRLPLGEEMTSPMWLEVGTTNAPILGLGLNENKVFFGLGIDLTPR